MMSLLSLTTEVAETAERIKNDASSWRRKVIPPQVPPFLRWIIRV